MPSDTEDMDHRNKRRGSALVVALVAVTAVAVLGAGLVQVAGSQLRRHGHSIDTKRALYLAEAGVAEAWLAIAQGKSGNVGTSTSPALLNGGLYWVEADWLPADQIALRSTGLAGTGRFAIETVVQRPSNPLADLGLFGEDEVRVGTQSVVDAWDSAFGEWKPPGERTQEEDLAVRVHSNGSVLAEGSRDTSSLTRILGDFRPGPGGEVRVGSGVEVTGSFAPKTSTEEIPEVQVPEAVQERPRTISVHTSLTSKQAFQSLTVGAEATLTLEGPMELVLGGLTVEPTGKLAIDGSGGPVTIYVDGPAHLPAGTGLDTVAGGAGKAALFLLEGQGEEPSEPPTVDFAPSGVYEGLILAPGRHLVIPSGLRLHGAVAAARLELAAGSQVTFDVQSRRNPAGGKQLPRLVCWRSVDLPASVLVQRRVDPMAQLDLAGITPPSPTDAHWERRIEMTYVDTRGAVTTYTGSIDTLDWNQVSSVISRRWIDSPAPVDTDLAQQDAAALDAATSAQMRDRMLGASPLDPRILYRAIAWEPAMHSDDLRQVLVANAPLHDKVACHASDPDVSPLTSADLRDVLIACSPLESSLLLRVEELEQMTEADKQAVRSAQ